MTPKNALEWVKAIEQALEQLDVPPGNAGFLKSVADQAFYYNNITPDQVKWVRIRIEQIDPFFFDNFDPTTRPEPNRHYQPVGQKPKNTEREHLIRKQLTIDLEQEETEEVTPAKPKPKPKKKDDTKFFNPMDQLAE